MACLALSLLLVGATGSSFGATGALESTDEIYVVIFKVDAGTIYVNLPRDMRAGERASGSVNPVPKGTAEDQARNRQSLGEFEVTLAGKTASASQPLRPFQIPANTTALEVVLEDRRGRTMGEVRVPLEREPAADASGYDVPSLGQSGSPVRIAGPFDGDITNSSARIGDHEATPVAEPPRQLVVRGPQEATADAPVEVKDRGTRVATGTYRNVNVQLSAGSTNLHSGETTTLTITVTGVEGLRETLPVQLSNHSPAVVRMEGGEEQTLCVRPDAVETNGQWKANRQLTGVRLGGFSISTRVSQPRPHGESRVRIPGSVQGELRGGVLLEQAARTSAGQALDPGAYAVLVRGAGENGAVSVQLGRQGQLLGTLPGTVLKRVGTVTVCDRDDVSEAVQSARSGSGQPTFSDLGFANEELFVVRPQGDGLLVELQTEDGDFSIHAGLLPSTP